MRQNYTAGKAPALHIANHSSIPETQNVSYTPIGMTT